MRIILGWLCILVMAVLGSSAVGAAASKKKPAPKKTAAKSAKTSTKKSSASSSKKSSSGKTSSKKSATKKRSTRRTARRPARVRQAAPAPERYKEIQDALAAKGYLDPADANGAWGQSSVAALKRFQADQKIQTTGKINSLSLIALGLGPKREPLPEKSPESPTPEVKPPDDK